MRRAADAEVAAMPEPLPAALPSCPCAGIGARAGSRRRPKQYALLAGRSRGRAHAGRAGRGAAAGRRRWSCWRPTTRSSKRCAPDFAGRAAGSRAAAAPPAPPASPPAWTSCASAAPPTTTGCWCTTPRAACCSPEWVDAPDRRLPGRRRRRPAGAAAGRHAEGGRRRPRRRHAGRAPTSGLRRRRRCSAWACCSARWPQRPAHGVTDEASAIEALGLRPLLVPGDAENFKLTWPADFALAARLLETRRMNRR